MIVFSNLCCRFLQNNRLTNIHEDTFRNLPDLELLLVCFKLATAIPRIVFIHFTWDFRNILMLRAFFNIRRKNTWAKFRIFATLAGKQSIYVSWCKKIKPSLDFLIANIKRVATIGKKNSTKKKSLKSFNDEWNYILTGLSLYDT